MKSFQEYKVHVRISHLTKLLFNLHTYLSYNLGSADTRIIFLTPLQLKPNYFNPAALSNKGEHFHLQTRYEMLIHFALNVR